MTDHNNQQQTGVSDTFIHPCNDCGATVHVTAGREQPHDHQTFSDLDSPAAFAWWQGYDAHRDLVEQSDVRPVPVARVAAYAEAICGCCKPEVQCEVHADQIAAVVAVADAELAELRAEVERLRAALTRVEETDQRSLHMYSDAMVKWNSRAEAAQAERDTYREQWHQEVENFERETVRAEAAEARLRAVEALADEHERMVTPAPYTTERALIERLRGILDAALASAAPAVSDGDGATSEAAKRVREFVVARDAFYGREAADEDLLDMAPVDEDSTPRATLLWSDLRTVVNAPAPETYDDRREEFYDPDWETSPIIRPASPVVAPSATEAPQAPADVDTIRAALMAQAVDVKPRVAEAIGVCCGDHDDEGGRPCHGCPERAPQAPAEQGFSVLSWVEEVGRQEAAERLFFVDKETGEPCPTMGNRLCTITDPDHRHKDGRPAPSPRPDTADDEGVRRG